MFLHLYLKMRSFYTIVLFILALANVQATHIVGGDFYYEYLGGDKYRITMKLYVDCYNGNPGAISLDETANIGIFTADDNQLYDLVEITRTGPIHLNGVVYKCIVNPGNVCVDQYNYVFVTELPKRKKGYILAFQRCCRNNTIRNIIDAEGTGATYWVQVPDRDVIATDNSPIFKKFPPIYVCKSFPFVFDHSATDKDGDSLSYELYQPYSGADRDSSRPVPPKGPPFNNVWWEGGFSTNDQMGGNPRLEIDEKTGELTVTPNALGQYVIGVKVLEWRKNSSGVYVNIGETLRDYQFNVVDCQAVTVAIFNTIVKCSDTVKFIDKSIAATTLTWDFGDPGSGIDNNTSTQKNPMHVYTKNGDYLVTLKAWNPACQDEYTLKVKVRTAKGFDLGKDRTFCTPIKTFLTVPFTDYSSILWSTGSKAGFITVSAAGKYFVEAKYANCPLLRDTINLFYDPVYCNPIRDSMFCDKVDINLEVTGRSPKSKIMWSVLDTSAKIKVTQEGRIILQVYNNNCTIYDTIDLSIAKIKPKLGPDIFICNDFVQTLDAGTQPRGTSFLWNDQSTNQTFITTSPGKYWVTTKLLHCSQTDTIQINNSKVILDIGPDRHFCDSIRAFVDGGPSNGAQTFYKWSTGDTSRIAFIQTPGKHWLRKYDKFGCENFDTLNFKLTASPIIDLGKDTSVICVRAPIKISPGDGFSSYIWEDGSSDKIRFVEITGKYYVTVTDEVGCKASDTMIVKTNPNLLPNKVYIPNAFTPNNDGLNDVFPFDEPVMQTDYNLKVFNRWGEKVYDSDINRQPWDGTTRKDDSQMDAYMWVASYKGCDGNRHTDKGTVTVIR
jgi:gliding motility-associated-like protein